MADINIEQASQAPNPCPVPFGRWLGAISHGDSSRSQPKRTLLLVAVTVFACLTASSIQAAPFCVEAQGTPTECWYYDIQICKKEALRQNGRCSANLQEISLADDAGQFCIIDSGMMPVCAYQSAESCNEAAASRNAVCFENIQDVTPDAYRFDRPIFRNN